MKTRVSALLLGLCFALSTILAQGQNCSKGTMSAGMVTGYMPCGAYNQAHIWSYNQTKYFVDTCTNTQTGVDYASIPSNVTSSGQCLDTEGDLLDCPVVFVNKETDGTGPGDYNRFYNQAYPQTIVPIKGFLTCVKGVMVQDFQQCAAQACTTGGGGGGGCGSGGCCNNPTQCSFDGSGQQCDSCQCSCVSITPIIVDTTGHGFHLTSAEAGVLFDFFGDNRPFQISWTAEDSGNGFLALDRNHNGRIDDGAELFGNLTPQPKSGDPNGYLALAEFDKPENGGNGDGIIDSRDAIYSKLVIWIDANHDGVSQPEELHSLPSMGVYSIGLKYQKEPIVDQYGNAFRFRGVLNPNPLDGQSQDGRYTYDVFFRVKQGREGCPKKDIPEAGKDDLLKERLP